MNSPKHWTVLHQKEKKNINQGNSEFFFMRQSGLSERTDEQSLPSFLQNNLPHSILLPFPPIIPATDETTLDPPRSHLPWAGSLLHIESFIL